MTKDNEKQMTKGQINDFDAVSLYPSAQKRLWYPTGNCKTLTQELI